MTNIHHAKSVNENEAETGTARERESGRGGERERRRGRDRDGQREREGQEREEEHSFGRVRKWKILLVQAKSECLKLENRLMIDPRTLTEYPNMHGLRESANIDHVHVLSYWLQWGKCKLRIHLSNI